MNNKDYKMVKDIAYRQDDFSNGKVLHDKKKNHLPAMGWNSWNAFGSGNTEALTKAMADAMVELELDKLGYKYVVLDDGCYKPARVDGKLSNETVKFPSGFKALADYIHQKGLKFGMYNDIGTNLCAGALVGTCGYEDVDASTYLSWDVDFLKVDNCYYLWDNATFSDPKNARYVFAPNIKAVRIGDSVYGIDAMEITGTRAAKTDKYITGIGTYDGTGPAHTPVGDQSSEVLLKVNVPDAGDYDLYINYATGMEEGCGMWLSLSVINEEGKTYYFDDMLSVTGSPTMFAWSQNIPVSLAKGENTICIANHRRQENTLGSYGTLVKELNEQAPDNDIIFSICEWGKTQPQNWGYKVGDSWRILNDITFRVGSDGDPGYGAWTSDYTTGVVTQYSKAVIMDEFAGLDKGWNDPDMLMIGMNGLTPTMNKTHMAMWCMMNSPLMLGLDLRRVKKGDELYNIIANEDMIALNQDSLGIQAKRIYSSAPSVDELPVDKSYITTSDRVDILAKPLNDGSVALCFINLKESDDNEIYTIDKNAIIDAIGNKLPDVDAFKNAVSYEVTDLWTKAVSENADGVFSINGIKACDNVTIRIRPV